MTGDDSTNSVWVALLTFGEGWHNNHHAVPQSARHGFAWYEVDPNWYGIWALRTVGLAWDISLPKFSPKKEIDTTISFTPPKEDVLAQESSGD